jgi:hypothetical protein
VVIEDITKRLATEDIVKTMAKRTTEGKAKVDAGKSLATENRGKTMWILRTDNISNAEMNRWLRNRTEAVAVEKREKLWL